MNTLFEQELRNLFGDGTIVHKPIFIGRTCFGTLGGDLRVRIEFDDPAVLRNYDSLSVKVINRLSGLVDHIDLPIVDLIGRKMIPDNPNFPDGVAPHIWIYNGTVEWYGYKPNAADRAAIRSTVAQYLNMFREPSLEPVKIHPSSPKRKQRDSISR